MIQQTIKLKDIIARVLSRLNIITPDATARNYRELIKNECRMLLLALCDKIIKEQQPEEVYYREKKMLTFDDADKEILLCPIQAVETETIKYKDFIRCEGGNPYGLFAIPYVKPSELERMAENEFMKKNTFFTVEGNMIKIKLSKEIRYNWDVYFVFYRQPILPQGEDSFIDLPTQKMDELCNLIIQQLQVGSTKVGSD